jgi:hypothetical protein
MKQTLRWLIVSASLASCEAVAPVDALPLLVQGICLTPEQATELVATDRAAAEAIAANNALIGETCE